MLRKFWPASVVILFVFGAAAIWLASDIETTANGRSLTLPVHPEPLVVETAGGKRSFTIEVADSPEERERGLMFREDMDDDHGMLFVFEEQRDVSFWMKNTPMPLDLIFISQDGTVKAIKRGQPFSEAMISPGVPVRFVLELKAGTAAESDIADGDKVRHRVISQAPGPAQPVQE
jgi:uncharacterized membrane protein (UPF0127 family)